MKIAIGVCAKNEGASIVAMLDSLLVTCKIASAIEPYLFICANGCSDHTIPLIKNWQRQHPYFFSKLYILQDGNLVVAQRLIIKKSKNKGAENTIFIDADILIDKDFMTEIVKEISNDTKIIAFYAKSIPLVRKKSTLIEKVLNQYDISGNLFSKRKHLHGRAFLIKTNKWTIPETSPQLVADDIYLSFHLLKQYGPKCIKNIDSAVVYFKQIKDYQDFYNAFRRRELEINKCLTLFPEFKSLPADHINRRFLWGKLSHEPFNRIFLWMTLLGLRKTAQVLFKVEKIIALDKKKDEWIPTKTSKCE